MVRTENLWWLMAWFVAFSFQGNWQWISLPCVIIAGIMATKKDEMFTNGN